MTDTVAVALIGLVGTLSTAAATVAAAYMKQVANRIGKPNGGGSLTGQVTTLTDQLDQIRVLLEEHIKADELAFSVIRQRLGLLEGGAWVD
jgi:formiminotetrahydrofolate cyclodeaminase